MWPNMAILKRWDGSILNDDLLNDDKDYNRWINTNSALRPDKLSSGAFQLHDFVGGEGCMIIAYVTMEGLNMKPETEASLELLDTISSLDDKTLSNFNYPMFFWTDD